MSATKHRDGAFVTIKLDEKSVIHMREVLRQQLLGDEELMRDVLAGREDPEIRLIVSDRMRVVRRLADQLGLPESLERRRDPAENPRRRLPVSVLPTTLVVGLILLVTGIVQAIDVFTGQLLGVSAFYASAVAVASLRFGSAAGYLSAVACALLYGTLALTDESRPLDGVALRSATLLAGLALLAWVTRRERFSGLVRRRTD